MHMEIIERGKCRRMNGGTNTQHDIKEFPSFAISFKAYQMRKRMRFYLRTPFPIFSGFYFRRLWQLPSAFFSRNAHCIRFNYNWAIKNFISMRLSYGKCCYFAQFRRPTFSSAFWSSCQSLFDCDFHIFALLLLLLPLSPLCNPAARLIPFFPSTYVFFLFFTISLWQTVSVAENLKNIRNATNFFQIHRNNSNWWQKHHCPVDFQFYSWNFCLNCA